jgi:hypothetical protein
MTVVATNNCVLPALNSCITLLFVSGFHATVNKADSELRQLLLQLFCSDLSSLGLELLRLFNQGTDPVSLVARRAGLLYALGDFIAAGV